MACERDRIIKLVEYLESLGIEINVAKNKARGNRGFFRVKNNAFRIDIAKGLDDDSALNVLVHEAAHFIHYGYDKKLKSLDFILDDMNDNITEELLTITVDSISKESIKPLFDAREKIKSVSMHPVLKKRALNNINNRISRLNRYYNSPTELFARSIEAYVINKESFSKKAPLLAASYDRAVKNNKIPVLNSIIEILLYNN